MSKALTPVELILGGVAAVMVGGYLYNKYKPHSPVPTPSPVISNYKAPLTLRSSGNTAQGTDPLIAVAANPQPFQVTDAFSPNILFSNHG